MERGFKLVPVLVVFGLLIGLFVFFAPVFESGKFDARRRGCRSNLEVIGQDIKEYQAKHRGKMPSDTASLVKNSKAAGSLFCPENLKSGYVYRASNLPNEIICWDDLPHIYTGFLWKRAFQERNVLFGNGKVKRMEESEFQKLGLRGTRIVPPKQ